MPAKPGHNHRNFKHFTDTYLGPNPTAFFLSLLTITQSGEQSGE